MKTRVLDKSKPYQGKSLVGKRGDGSLQVPIEFAGYDEKGKDFWLCQCDCGSPPKIIRGNDLRRNSSKSCGCLRRNRAKARGSAVYKYGKRRTRKEYHAWENMIQRCTNQNHTYYHRYGGRGIKVCDRWRESYDNFFIDMGESPKGDYSVGRIDNDGNYEPGNCEWQNRNKQQNNRSCTRYVEVDGENKSLGGLAGESGKTIQQLATRFKYGWTPEEAMNIPVKPHERHLTYQGKSQSMSAWARELGINLQTISSRLRRGATEEEALNPPISHDVSRKRKRQKSDT